MRFGWSGVGERIGKTLSRLAGIEGPSLSWRLVHQKPWFDNHVSSLAIRGREASLKVEKTLPEDAGKPYLYPILERRLA